MPRRPRRPKVEVQAKVWWQSRTLAVNVIGFAIIAIGIVLDSAGKLGISDQALAWLGLLLAILNAALRFSTNQPLSGFENDTKLVEGAPGAEPVTTLTPQQMLATAEYLKERALREEIPPEPLISTTMREAFPEADPRIFAPRERG